jgi:alpha-1,6-mannosyltransferase
VAANIYIDNYSAQTGASLFLQLNSPPYAFIPPPPQVWKYDKTESLTLTDLANSHFTHVLTGNPTAFGGEKWDVLESIEGFERIGWRRIGGVRVPEIIVMDKLWIMQSKERSGR